MGYRGPLALGSRIVRSNCHILIRPLLCQATRGLCCETSTRLAGSARSRTLLLRTNSHILRRGAVGGQFLFSGLTMGKQRDISSFFGAKASKKSNEEKQEEKQQGALDGVEDKDASVLVETSQKETAVIESSSDEEASLSSSVSFESSEDSEEDEGVDRNENDDDNEKKRRAPASSSQKAKKTKNGVKVPISPTKKQDKQAIEGVGALGLKAAKEHEKVDIESLISWTRGEPVPFSFLTNTFEAIAEESKRLVITSLLTNAFRAIIEATPEDLLATVYLCTNQVSPAHVGIELGIGDATLVKAICMATGKKESAVKAQYDETGDLGIVAAHARGSQKTMFKPKPLTVRKVLSTFRDIASAEGSKSQERKKNLIIQLLAAASENEAGYLMRALQGKLRIGLAEQTVLVSLAHATVLQRGGILDENINVAEKLEEASRIVKGVYSECPSYDDLVPALLSLKIEEVPSKVHFKPGVPIKPMLAKPTNGVSEVLDKFSDQPFTCEYKYDGERAQIHVLEDGSVKIYSRNSENNTGKYPDIIAMFPEVLCDGIKSIVLDAEAVAYDPEAKKILPFQVLSTRARKAVTLDSIKVQVCVFAFDCLYLNGEALLKKSLSERREALHAAIKPTPGKMELATAKTSHDVEELSKFLDESVERGTEGLIVKTLDDSYEPSKRSSHWLKLKKDYLDGVGDTFDLVPIGAWYGKGKRTGVYGSYLLAIWDSDNEQYQVITKIGTGFSEELLKDLSQTMGSHVIPSAKGYFNCPDSLTPDVWFEPKTVWEVKAADLSISPVYRAGIGLVDEGKGISIRFPRLVRVRDDKGPEDSTSPDQVADMYRSQATVGNK